MSMYYNIKTQEVKSRFEIKKLFPNVSLQHDFESYGGWYKLYEGEKPETDASHRVVEGEIKKVNAKWVQTYNLEAIPAEELLAIAKMARAQAVSEIVVTVDGMQFDGNEQAQERMARAIVANKTGSLQWVLANNTVATVSIEQLSRALLEAQNQQTALWVAVYE